MVGKILLIKFGSQVRPYLVVSKNGNRKLIVSQIKPFKSRNEKNVVLIGQPPGLRFKSVAIAYRLDMASEDDIVAEISKLSMSLVKKVKVLSQDFIRRQQLHEEMHIIKKKISTAQFNNQDYRDLENRLDDILRELGYESPYRPNNRFFAGHKVAPSTGFIKIYRG